jgi:hypothetical protein
LFFHPLPHSSWLSDVIHLHATSSKAKLKAEMVAADRSRVVFDCRMANDPATINKESTNENNTDVDHWVDARRLRINGKPCT